MFSRGNPFVRAREETSSTCGASHLRAELSLSWPSHIHIQPNLLKSCHSSSSLLSSLSLSQVYIVDNKDWWGELSVMLMSFVLCGSPPGSHNSSLSGCDILYPSTSMDDVSIAGPSQELSSFLAFLRMLLSDGEVEGGVGVDPTALAAAASGDIGIPQLGIVGLPATVVAPMVVNQCSPTLHHWFQRCSPTLCCWFHSSPSRLLFDSPFMELCLLLHHELGVFTFIVIAKVYS